MFKDLYSWSETNVTMTTLKDLWYEVGNPPAEPVSLWFQDKANENTHYIPSSHLTDVLKLSFLNHEYLLGYHLGSWSFVTLSPCSNTIPGPLLVYTPRMPTKSRQWGVTVAQSQNIPRSALVPAKSPQTCWIARRPMIMARIPRQYR